MKPHCPKGVHDLLIEVQTPGSRELFADVNRMDTYTPDGTQVKPYKVGEDAITAANVLATAASPVIVHFAPGTYDMDPVSLSTYVKVQGAGWGVTIFKSNDLTTHFITLGAGSILRDVNIWGPTTPTKACIYHNANNTSPVVVADVTISRGSYGFLSEPNSSIGVALLENFTFAYAGSNIDELVHIAGFSQTFVTTSLASGPVNSITRAWSASNANAVLTLVDCYHKVSGGEGVFADDSAWVRVVSSIFSNGTTAIRLGSNGSPAVRCEATLIHRTFGGGYTYDLKLDSVNASLFYSGRCSRDRISNTFNGELLTLGMNDKPGEEGALVLGEFSVGAGPGSVLPMISYGRDAYLSGLVSGGEVTRNAGRVLDVAAGSGYVNDGVNPVKVTWTGPTQVTVAAGATEYIYVTSAGTVSRSAVQPAYASNIVLAQATADASDIVVLTKDEIAIGHSLSRIQEFFEDVIGPLSVSAAAVTASATPLKLKLADGEFTVGISERDVTGSDPVTFTPVYRDGSGGWVFDTPTDTIDVDHYDNNAGTPSDYGMTDKYKKDAIYVLVSDDGTEVFLVYGQTAFLDQAAAEAGSMPVAPDVLSHYGMRAAGVISHEGAAAIDLVMDTRPMLGQNAPSTSAVPSDHDLLLNLDHDTHLQYLDTTRALTWHSGLPGAHVTNGDAHDHTGGSGAQIDHLNLANIGTLTHLQLETAISLRLLAAEKAAVNGVASLNGSSLVVQNPANATATPTPAKIPISDVGGLLNSWVANATALIAGLMTAADFTKLAGITPGAGLFGSYYQSVVSAARSTWNTNTSFQTKVTLTTPAVPAGTYRVGWTATVDQSNSAQSTEAQLYNVTDAAIVGVVDIYRPPASINRKHVCAFAEVTFTGAAKTFEIQYRTSAISGTAGISDARIELWRVS